MVPRTKLQQRVFSLSQGLNSLTIKQEFWAVQECLEHIGYRNKTNTSCLDCGHLWVQQRKVNKSKCPSCGTPLIIKETRKKIFEQNGIIFSIVTVVEEFQVVRFFQLSSSHRFGYISKHSIREIVQQWFTPEGRLTIVGRTLAFHNTGFSGNMEVRANISNYYSSNKYDLYTDKIYPEATVLPIYARNGFTHKITDIQPYSFFKNIVRDSKAETLLKAGQFGLLSAQLGSKSNDIYRYWRSIKICMRQKYIIREAGTWLDYLQLLEYFKKDLNNAKFICPKNLKQEHDRLVAKKTIIVNRQRIERDRLLAEKNKRDLEKAADDYLKAKALFIGLVFSKGNLNIKVLENIEEFRKEANAHQHCVYTNEYYAKEDSLILSAKVGDKPMETIEISLSKMKVIQSRGLGNKPSEYNREILELVKKSLPIIKKKYKQLVAA